MSTTFKQEMPPPGGYPALNFARVPPKKFFTGGKWFIFNGVATVVWYFVFRITNHEIHHHNIENLSGNIALEPMLKAERDRAYLKQIRKNRDDEREAMKKVEGWEVGTYYGEPIYKTLPEDTFVDPGVTEFYAQSRQQDLYNYVHWRHYFPE